MGIGNAPKKSRMLYMIACFRARTQESKSNDGKE